LRCKTHRLRNQKIYAGTALSAQNAGLIKKPIADNNDEPAIQWKKQIPQNTNLARKLRDFFHF